jgi:hypothetical protein
MLCVERTLQGPLLTDNSSFPVFGTRSSKILAGSDVIREWGGSEDDDVAVRSSLRKCQSGGGEKEREQPSKAYHVISEIATWKFL